ncbi:tautomerase family protein [Streptomyces klenkii]|uniref:tautomerase family protein n=1 Tax=Streptomyces klenkii TaxID=1420899 RepID=UPI00341F696D
MPIYTCLHAPGVISKDQKKAIADEITRIHCGVTGAPRSFVNAYFTEVAHGSHFRGGKPADEISVQAVIRAGRSWTDKQRIAREVSEAVAKVTGRDVAEVSTTVMDLDNRFIFEFGSYMPQPGTEKDWIAGLQGRAKELVQEFN